MKNVGGKQVLAFAVFYKMIIFLFDAKGDNLLLENCVTYYM